MNSCAVDVKENSIESAMGINTSESDSFQLNTIGSVDIEDKFKSSGATNYLESIKAWKNIEKIIDCLVPSDLEEVFSISSNNNFKINWDEKALYDVLYTNESSIFVPLGCMEQVGNGYYIMNHKDMVYSNPDDFIHENGVYGLIIRFDNNMIQSEYAYCEYNFGLSLDGENCDFVKLDFISGEDTVENYIFDSLNAFNLFN